MPERRPRGRPLRAGAGVLLLEGSQAREVPDGGDELRVVPGLAEVVRGALPNERDRGLEGRPGRHEEDGQGGVGAAQVSEQGGAVLARCRARAEVHVLHDEADPALGHGGERFRRVSRDADRDVVEVEEKGQGLRHGRVVLDDQDRGHGLCLAESCAGPTSAGDARPGRKVQLRGDLSHVPGRHGRGDSRALEGGEPRGEEPGRPE